MGGKCLQVGQLGCLFDVFFGLLEAYLVFLPGRVLYLLVVKLGHRGWWSLSRMRYLVGGLIDEVG